MLRGKTGMSAALVCMAMLAVGGCTQTDGGTPSPTSGTPTTDSAASSIGPSDTSGADTAPAITNPLDVSKFMADPCLSITSSQAADLTINSQGERDTADSSDSCDWKYGPNLQFDVAVMYVVPDAKNGLQNLYNQKATGWYDQGYFEPAEVDGYPALYQDSSDNRQNGQCQLTVGVNQENFFTVMIHGERNTDLCQGAAKVAGAVVDTIKRG